MDPAGKKKGLIALKDIPSKFRITVEGFDNVDKIVGCGHHGHDRSHCPDLKDMLNSVSKSRYESRGYDAANHACDSNASKTVDEDYKVSK
jgi:hypothetical protein